MASPLKGSMGLWKKSWPQVRRSGSATVEPLDKSSQFPHLLSGDNTSKGQP